jgi:GxxExxY protein
MNADDFGVNQVSERIIGCAFRVSNALGAGFVEKVYENALAHEMRKTGLAVVQQHGIVVHYDAVVVGQYAVDLLVENTVMVELKAIKALDNAHDAQCINYLRATGLPLCLLLNFSKPRVEIRRFRQQSITFPYPCSSVVDNFLPCSTHPGYRSRGPVSIPR